jgi:hypothetical protein
VTTDQDPSVERSLGVLEWNNLVIFYQMYAGVLFPTLSICIGSFELIAFQLANLESLCCDIHTLVLLMDQ